MEKIALAVYLPNSTIDPKQFVIVHDDLIGFSFRWISQKGLHACAVFAVEISSLSNMDGFTVVHPEGVIGGWFIEVLDE
ncbi:hypothetical protein [Vibrio crassostreae]|uniref:hypothetical protein n=1 Tax=Vibrio crassostreae TaxID=246167 RepID=UPI001B30A68F|nr:hypothetical protein [Vibrio crassostreae]